MIAHLCIILIWGHIIVCCWSTTLSWITLVFLFILETFQFFWIHKQGIQSWTCDWFNCVGVVLSIKCIQVVLLKLSFPLAVWMKLETFHSHRLLQSFSFIFMRGIVPICEKRWLCIETCDLLHTEQMIVVLRCSWKKHITQHNFGAIDCSHWTEASIEIASGVPARENLQWAWRHNFDEMKKTVLEMKKIDQGQPFSFDTHMEHLNIPSPENLILCSWIIRFSRWSRMY